MSELDLVRARYLEVNGDHPMAEADDRYVRDRYRPMTAEEAAQALDGRLPLPSYLLSDGTPMVPKDLLQPAERAGGVERLHDWFVRYWPAGEQDVAEMEWASYLSGRYVCLDPVTPYTIRRKAALVGQAEQAAERLAADPRDPFARGSLAEASDGLDRLLAPMTGYDELRFGGPSVRQQWVERPRTELLRVEPPALPIRTERLVLRHHTSDDVDDIHAYYGREDVATYLLYEPWSRPDFEDRMLEWDGRDDVFGVVMEYDGRVIGDVVLMFRGPSQAELGWVVHPDYGGRGLVTEATQALLDVGFRHYGFHRIWAELDARNTASARMCERLGMRRESHRIADYWSKGEWTDTLQYALLASEWADRRAGS